MSQEFGKFDQPPIIDQDQAVTPEQEAERAKFEAAFLTELKRAVIEEESPPPAIQKEIGTMDHLLPAVQYNDNGTVKELGYMMRVRIKSSNESLMGSIDYRAGSAATKKASALAEQNSSQETARMFVREMLRREMERIGAYRQQEEESAQRFQGRYNSLPASSRDPRSLDFSEEAGDLSRAIQAAENRVRICELRSAGLTAEVSKWK